jgi:hypothetical protein
LSQEEYAAIERAAAPTGDGILMFMANAALEKVTQSGAVSLKRAAKQPSCLCFYDAGVGELTGEIPLVEHELPEVVIAAYRQRTSVDHFIADAIKEKLGRECGPSISELVQAAHREMASAAPQRVQDIRKLVIWKDTWGIANGANQALHRTLSGQLLIVNKTVADMSGNEHFHNPRWASYSEACELIRNSGYHWKPEVLLQFHGIQAPAANVAAAARPSVAARMQAG